jgi:CRISPR-associated protein Cas6
MPPDADIDAAARPADVVDAVFAISCRALPVDHAYALSRAVGEALPWFASDGRAGMHTIHGAESGAGWMRPEGPDALLQLSRRARLALRLPRERLGDAAALVGRTLQVGEHALRVERLALRPLSRITTLFARCVVLGAPAQEPDFLAQATAQLEALGIRAERLVCGRGTDLATPQGTWHARSLMLAGLTPEGSLRLQERGLGEGRKLGCGLFIAHKDIADLRSRTD